MKHNNGRLSLLLGLLFIFVFGAASLFASEKELLRIYDNNLTYKHQVYEAIEDFIEKHPDYNNIDELYLKLAELSSEIYLTEPEKVLKNYQKVLEINPYHPMRDVILYNIAFYSSDYAKKQRDQRRAEYIRKLQEEERIEPILTWEGEYRLSEASLKEAVDSYKEIIERFPESRYHSESIYRLAVLLYEIGLDADVPREYYERAKNLLNQVVEKDKDDYRYFGLYQRGWANFSTGRFTEAIEDFSDILNVVEEDEILRSYFEYDAIENIAYSLERMDEGDYFSPAKSVEFAQDNLFDLIDSDEYSDSIIRRVIELKLDLNAPFHAVNYMEAFLEMFPLAPENPMIVDSMATMYQRYSYMITDEEEVRNRVYAQKEKLITAFHVDTEWYQHNSQNDISEQIELIRSAYEFLQPRYFNRFVTDRSDDSFAEYREFVARYQEFPEFSDERGEKWLKQAQNSIVSGALDFAQSKEEPFYYLQAYQIITDFNEMYPDNDDYLEYEFSKFLVIENLYTQLNDQLEEEPYSNEEKDLTISKEDLSDIYITSTQGFIDTFSDPEIIEDYLEDIIGAYYKRSLIYLDKEMYSEAEADMLALLDLEISSELKREVYVNLADINRTRGDYLQAENYFRSAADFALDEDDRQNIGNNYRRLMQEQANTLAADSSYVEAAQEYLRLAEEFRTTDVSRFVGLTHEAINSYVKAQEYETAIDLLIGLSEYRSEPQEAYFLYVSAWDIADTLMSDKILRDEIRHEYVEKYPASNQAYRTRYEIIEELAREEETKYRAADMLLELHEDAVAGRIDHGDDNTEDIYYDAINLYHDSEDKEFLVSLMLGFTERYSEDPRTDGLLEYVAGQYLEMDMQEEFEELARYIFQRNPDSKLYENIARNRILEKYDDIVELLSEEKFDEMFAAIEEFRDLDRQFREENLVLDLEDFYLDFEDFRFTVERIREYRAFLVAFERTLDEIEENFVNAEPNDLIRVNQHTTWMEHMAGGVKRLDGIITEADKQRDTIMGLLVQARDYEEGVSLELNTRAIYLIGRVYDYAAEVVDIQMERFYNVSNQMRELRDYDEDEYNVYIDSFNVNYREPYVNFLRYESAGWYNNLVTNFVYNLEYSDQFTEAAMERLGDWGLLTERMYLYSNNDWLAARSDLIDNLDMADWNTAAIVSEVSRLKEMIGMDETEAVPIWLSAAETEIAEPDTLNLDSEVEAREEKAYFMRNFEVDGEVVEASLSFVAYDTSMIMLNGYSIVSEPEIVYDEELEKSYYIHNINIPIENFVVGQNTILIETDGSADDQAIIFNMEVMVSKR